MIDTEALEKDVLVQLRSGRRLEIPVHDTVFVVDGLHEGQAIDPSTVKFRCEAAADLLRGDMLIIDNVVETVVAVIDLRLDSPKVLFDSHYSTL